MKIDCTKKEFLDLITQCNHNKSHWNNDTICENCMLTNVCVKSEDGVGSIDLDAISIVEDK